MSRIRKAVLRACVGLLLTTSIASADDLPDGPLQGGTVKASPQLRPLSPMAELGRRLFFDPILSLDRTVSCASCHKPELAYADDVRLSLGIGGKTGSRNTPSAMNTAARVALFWDGRSPSLEHQALQPIENPVEMALPLPEAIKRLNDDPNYAQEFQKVFNAIASEKTLGRAIAAFEKTLETANSPYDRYAQGEDGAMSAQAIRGRLLFIGKANCAVCHTGEDFTSDRFKNIGLYDGVQYLDVGRAEITKNAHDEGLFKVPSLRNVALTAPYMHNGMFKTLREVIEYYDNPDSHMKTSRNRDALLDKPLNLTKEEIADIEAFLHALTDDRFKSPAASASGG